MRNRDGFTLLELVAALSLSAVIGIWAAGFFGSQMHEYKKQTQILKAEELADRVCFQITSRLDHAFLFRVDPKESRSEERRVGKECRSRWSPYH